MDRDMFLNVSLPFHSPLILLSDFGFFDCFDGAHLPKFLYLLSLPSYSLLLFLKVYEIVKFLIFILHVHHTYSETNYWLVNNEVINLSLLWLPEFYITILLWLTVLHNYTALIFSLVLLESDFFPVCVVPWYYALPTYVCFI